MSSWSLGCRCRDRCRRRRHEKPSSRRNVDLHAARCRSAELRRIGQQVDQHLHQAVAIGLHGRHWSIEMRVRMPIVRSRKSWLVAATASTMISRKSSAVTCHFGAPRLELREIEHLVDEAGQSLALLDDDAEELLALARDRVSGSSSRISEKARIDVSGVRSSCVTVRDEVVLQPVELLQPLVRCAQLAQWRPPARATSARARGCSAMACDASSRMRMTSSIASGLLLHHRCDHRLAPTLRRSRRRAAFRRMCTSAASARSANMRGPAAPPRVGGGKLVGTRGAEEPRSKFRATVIERRAAAPELRAHGRRRA